MREKGEWWPHGSKEKNINAIPKSIWTTLKTLPIRNRELWRTEFPLMMLYRLEPETSISITHTLLSSSFQTAVSWRHNYIYVRLNHVFALVCLTGLHFVAPDHNYAFKYYIYLASTNHEVMILLGPLNALRTMPIQVIQISSCWFTIAALANPGWLVCSKRSAEERESKRKLNLAKEESYEWNFGCLDYERKYTRNSVFKVPLFDLIDRLIKHITLWLGSDLDLKDIWSF